VDTLPLIYRPFPPQWQAIFQKAGVNNQLELMSILRDLTTTFGESYGTMDNR
jgi:hypothetical protein